MMVARHDHAGEPAQIAPHHHGSEEAALDVSPYAGHWIAVLKGRVVAVGETAREALLAARYQCVKDEPALIWVSTESPKATCKK